MATRIRRRKYKKWWVLEVGTDKIVSGPYDNKEEAEAARPSGGR
ncbi:hypothetical protein ACQEU6_23245 [Spirillospora sp. CA-108201]